MMVANLHLRVILLFLGTVEWLYSANCLPDSTTPSFLPSHMDLKESDKFSVPPAKGKDVMVGNITVYESPRQGNPKLLLITIYDIFGFHPHVKYIADRLSESGFLVVIPDLFHGNPVPLENFPQPNFTERAKFLFDKNGSWVENKPDILQVIQYYEQQYGIRAVGMYGFCWGGKISVFAASDDEFTSLKAIGLVHPSRVKLEDAPGVRVPAILLPSKAEENMLPFLNTLNKNVKTHVSEHFRYSSLPHGFAGARSDFSDPVTRKSVEDVISRLTNFFNRTMNKQ